MRSRHCRVCSGWHDLNGVWPRDCLAHFGTRGPRSELSAPMVIRDGMEPIQSMADGRMYDSKRAYEQGVKAAGCVIVGNEKAPFDNRPTEYVPEGVGQSISDAIDQLRAA